MIRFLELEPPGARRHTWTAGTTHTSLHGLLAVAIHDLKTLLEPAPVVNLILVSCQTSLEMSPYNQTQGRARAHLPGPGSGRIMPGASERNGTTQRMAREAFMALAKLGKSKSRVSCGIWAAGA